MNQTTDQTTRLAEEPQPLFCAYHPNRETVLRCNRCGQPICFDCAVRTPVGYRCKQCVRQQQSVYYNAHSADLVVAGLVALVLGGIAGVLAYLFLGALGFFSLFLAFLVGPALGGMIAEAVRQSVGRRRARSLNVVAVAAVVLGMMIGIGLLLTPASGSLIGALLRVPLLVLRRWDLPLLAVLAASTIYWRLR